jgi:hypothetical protein
MKLSNACGRRATLAVVFAATLAATGAVAGPRDHADGFFLRLSSGIGTGSTKLETADWKFSGMTTDFNFAVGAIVTPNLALHGSLLGWVMTDPSLKRNDIRLDTLDGDLIASGLGIGFTYYVMPANVYLSASLGAGSIDFDGRLRNDGGTVNFETDDGPIFDVTIGKEWWVGNKWALGVAAGLQYHSFGDPDINADWSGTSYCLRFSATMN